MALEQLPRLTSQNSLVERVKYQITVGTPLVFVTGAFESGKTVFSEQLISSMDEDSFVCAFVPCQEKLSVEKLRELLLKQLSGNIVFNAEDHLLGTVQRMGFGPKRVLIVIDDIDKAPQEFFDDIVQVYRTYAAQGVFSVILTSSQAWSDSEARKVKKEGLQPVEMEIQPLTLPESLTLITYYRRFYGMPALSDKELKGFYDIYCCGTNPGEIRKIVEAVSKGLNPVANAQEGKASQASGKKPSRKMDFIIAGAALVLLAVGAGVYATRSADNTDPKVNVALKETDEFIIPKADSQDSAKLGPELNHQRTDLNPVVVINPAGDEGTPVIIQEDYNGQTASGSSDEGTESIVLITDDDNTGDKALVITENTISTAEREAEGDLSSGMSSGTEKDNDSLLAQQNDNSSDGTLIAANNTPADKPEVKNTPPDNAGASDSKKEQQSSSSKKETNNKDNSGKKPSVPKTENAQKKESDSANKAPDMTSSKDSSKDSGNAPVVLNGGKDKNSGKTAKSDDAAKKTDNSAKKTNSKKDDKPSLPMPKSPDVDFSTLPGNHYTLQLIASNKAGVEKLRKRLKSGWILFRPERNDYILVYGDFASRSEAEAAKSRFPADIRANKPWSKQVSQVNKETSH